MLDILAAAALGGAMIVADATPPKLYTVDVALGSPASARGVLAKLDCSKLLLTYGGITVDTSLPLQHVSRPSETSAEVTTEAQDQAFATAVASQLATGRHAAVGLSPSGPRDCMVSFIAADPLPDLKATDGKSELPAHVVTAKTQNVAPVKETKGYLTTVIVAPLPSSGAQASAVTGASPHPVASDCRNVTLTVDGRTLDGSKSHNDMIDSDHAEAASKSKTFVLFPAEPSKPSSAECTLTLYTRLSAPGTVTAVTIAGAPARVESQSSTPIYGEPPSRPITPP